MAKMSDLNARGITNLHDYVQGRKDERDYIIHLLEKDTTLEKQLRFIEGDSWVNSVKIILMGFLLLHPELHIEE
jgi:hypothetical protein